MTQKKQSPAVVVLAIIALIAGVGCIGYLAMQIYQPIPERVSFGKKSDQVEQSDEPTPLYELQEQEREYLWDLEHHGNLLNQFGFK
jgi:hypothetical protein